MTEGATIVHIVRIRSTGGNLCVPLDILMIRQTVSVVEHQGNNPVSENLTPYFCRLWAILKEWYWVRLYNC